MYGSYIILSVYGNSYITICCVTCRNGMSSLCLEYMPVYHLYSQTKPIILLSVATWPICKTHTYVSFSVILCENLCNLSINDIPAHIFSMP